VPANIETHDVQYGQNKTLPIANIIAKTGRGFFILRICRPFCLPSKVEKKNYL